MAISKNGAYGHPNGKIGKLIHYMLKGQPVVRVVGRKSNKLSDKQRPIVWPCLLLWIF